MASLDAVGLRRRRVALVQAPHAVHFIVDEAGNVLNVLHVGPAGDRRQEGASGEKEEKTQPRQCDFIIIAIIIKWRRNGPGNIFYYKKVDC